MPLPKLSLTAVIRTISPIPFCGVIEQGSHKRNRCQFSYKCDGLHERFSEAEAYNLVGNVAHLALGEPRDLTGGATFIIPNPCALTGRIRLTARPILVGICFIASRL